MTMRISKDRIDMDDKVLQRPVLKDYAETVTTGTLDHLSFDGVDDHVSIGDVAALKITGDQTIAMWLHPTSFDVRQNPFAKAYGGEGTITQELSGGLTYYYGTAGANASPYQSVPSSTSLDLHTWTHVAIVRDLTNSLLHWYFNGVVVNSVAATYGSATASTLAAYIARGYTNYYEGGIRDVRVYNTALSSGDIGTIYNGGSITSGLVGHWELNDGSGTTAADDSASNNDGTLTGGPLWGHTLDLREGNVFDVTLTGNWGLTFANPPAAGAAGNFTLALTQDGTGSRTVTWPAAVAWLGDTPTLQTAAGSVDVFTFLTVDGGATWYGSHEGSA